MAFDQSTRTRLQRFVSEARTLLTAECTRQLQHEYGMNPATGEVVELSRLPPLDDTRWETARLLRDTLAHYLATSPSGGRTEALQRIVREQAFTMLNRLVALRMMEARGLLLESIARGYQSRGFQLYQRLAGAALGETGDAYRCYLVSLFDEFALDLAVLFDRFSPQGRLFPREAVFLALLNLINHPDIETLWAEDETIGWIYQYYNSQEERRQMRADSPAPRNSRELAVRNQFFTPRYVVEFLTDNTLGRLWYEMTQGRTALTEQCRYLVRRPQEIFLQPGEEPPEQEEPHKELSQEELLQQPVHIPFRALKDPRDIRMLDPACGSMHFGLYAFDLFKVIYDEAWEIAHSSDEARKSSASFVSFVVQYPDKAAFRADVPRLIIEHNLHGIDIDHRAVQIAGLSLWLRAQRTWQQQGLRPQDRPHIRRSHIVCAEPMPGEEAFLDEFIETHLSATPEHKLLSQLVRRVFDAMKLAGEAGSLLKIEEEIAGAVAEAKQKWLADTKPEQGRLFADDTATPAQKERSLDVTGITDETFWEKAEERIYAALHTYAELVEHGSYQRRLFADDAARGFAFIDVCCKRYDVVLMNPPFGEATKAIYEQDIPTAAGSSREIASLFLTRSGGQLAEGGRIGMLATRLLMFLDQLEEWRKATFASKNFSLVADLGYGVLDAVVEPAAFVVSAEEGRIGTFFRLLSAADKEAALAAAITSRPGERNIFIVSNCWTQIPGNRIAYWAPNHWLDLFAERTVEAFAKVSKGLETGEDERFLRLTNEVPAIELNRRWRRYAKGGDYQPVAGNYELVVDFGLFPVARRTTDSDLYGKAGVTYTQRTTSFLSFRALPSESVFSPGGPGIIPQSAEHLELLLSYLGSRPIGALVELCVGSGDSAVRGSAARNYTTGIIKDLPCLIDHISEVQAAQVRETIHERFRCVQRHQLGLDELSPTFQGVVVDPMLTLRQIAHCQAKSFVADALKVLSADWIIDKLWRDIFRFSEADCKFLDDEFAHHPRQCGSGNIPEEFWGNSDLPAESDEISEVPVVGVSRQLMKRSHIVHCELESLALRFDCRLEDVSEDQRFYELLIGGGRPLCEFLTSYGMGVAFGRWDIWFATGEKPAPELPDPFAPLPVCPPSQLQNEQGLPITKEDVSRLKEEGRWHYPLEIPWDGILVDDPGHPLDLEARVHQVLQIIWTDRWEAIEREACEILGVRTLRDYFRKAAGFFADHLKRYSKSRRKAPIYWPLQTPSGSYTLWLYYHRLNDQTLYTCVNDFVEKSKLREVTEQLHVLRTKTSRSRQEENDLERLLDLEHELQNFRDELLRVAEFWKPNLNDGVQITAAPLWKLFQHKPWQKMLKETWDKLEKGDYDWAHIAYSIWPDRVRKKCRHDKSLAIAHGLEDLYEAPPEQPKKKRGRTQG